MKKIYTIAVLSLLFLFTANSQNRIGFNFVDVYTEFNYPRYQLTETSTTESSTLQITQDTMITTFIFDKNFVCTETKLVPREDIFIQELFTLFSQKYTTVIPNEKWSGAGFEVTFHPNPGFNESYFYFKKV